MSVSNMILLGVGIISDFGVGADTALYTGEKVCRNHMTWTSCVKAAAATPAHTTHSLSATQTAASHEWVSLEPTWKRHYHPEAVSMSHPQLISFNEDKQCVRVPANNDWCHASTSSYGKYGLENFRSKEFRAQAPRCWHPTHILLDPGSAGRGPQRTTAINNSLTRYSTQ